MGCPSRVPIAYLLPALPTAAWWIAQRPPCALRLWPGMAWLLATLLALGTLLLPHLNPHKFPARFYASLPPGESVSFKGSAPYSAEFYLGERVRRDGSGALQVQQEGRRWVYRETMDERREATDAEQAPTNERRAAGGCS